MSINETDPLLQSKRVDTIISVDSKVGPAPEVVTLRSERKHTLRYGFPAVKRVGLRKKFAAETFFILLRIPWWGLALTLGGAYFLISLTYGGLLMAAASEFDPAPTSFSETLFLAASVMTAQGSAPYIALGPGARILIAFMGMTSVICAAVITGLIFARFSAPTARAVWSDYVTICPFEGRNALIVRVANERCNFSIKAHAQLSIGMNITTAEGIW